MGEHDGERVGDDEGGHEHRHEREGEQKGTERAGVADRLLQCPVEEVAVGEHVGAVTDDGSHGRGERVVGGPRGRGDDESGVVGGPGQGDHVGRGQADHRAAHVHAGTCHVDDADERERVARPGAGHLDRVAGPEALLPGGTAVEHRLAGPLRHPAGGEVDGLQRRVEGYRGDHPEAGYRPTVAAGQRTRRGRRALGRPDARQFADRVEVAGFELLAALDVDGDRGVAVEPPGLVADALDSPSVKMNVPAMNATPSTMASDDRASRTACARSDVSVSLTIGPPPYDGRDRP